MARIHIFLGLFSIVYFLEAIGGSYIIAAIQNIEKQFQIPARVAGFMISASDIGYIPTVLFISYFGSRGNRVRWIGFGAVLTACTYLMIASPNFIFPVPVPQANLSSIEDELSPKPSQLSANATIHELFEYPLIRDRLPKSLREHILGLSISGEEVGPDLVGPVSHPNITFYSIDGWLLEEICDEAEDMVNGTGDAAKLVGALQQFVERRNNNTEKDLRRIRRSANAPFTYCSRLVNNIRQITKETNCTKNAGDGGPFAVMFLALLLLGIGRTMPWTLGVPLLDDNVKKRKMPIYFAIIQFIRILGPICGHLIGSFVNKIYYTLNAPPGLSANDPTWIGAWWMGFLFVGSITLFPSIVLFFFPSGKPKKGVPPTESKKDMLEFFDKHKEHMKEGDFCEKTTEFLQSYKKVLSSKIYRGAVLGRICDILAFKGYLVFLPKYLENHYGIPLYRVHQYMALFGVCGFALGTITGGFVLRRFKLNGRKAAIMVLLMSALNLLMFFSKSFIACESVVNSIGVNNQHHSYNFTRQCNMDCACDGAKLYPVCDKTGFAYYSPCHAGCREVKVTGIEKTHYEFQSCECVPSGIVRKEFCRDNCTVPMIIFFITVITGSFFAGCGVVPGILILLRSVPPATRSISLGLQGLLVSLLGTLPSPVLWGLVVDSACLVWEKTCPGQTGNCSIYDPRSLRMRLHFLYCGIRLISLATDIYVWYHAKHLNIMEEDEEKKEPAIEVVEDLRRGSIMMEHIPDPEQ